MTVVPFRKRAGFVPDGPVSDGIYPPGFGRGAYAEPQPEASICVNELQQWIGQAFQERCRFSEDDRRLAYRAHLNEAQRLLDVSDPHESLPSITRHFVFAAILDARGLS